MTFQDFLAASPGDERLAMTNWLRYVFWDRVLSPHPPKNNELPTVRFEDQADAVLAELARQREADRARIEKLTIENQLLELQVTELIWQS